MAETITVAATVTLGVHNTKRELGISYRQLDHWIRLGLLKPLHLGGGSGNAREWTRAELNVARTMGRLVAAGLKPEPASRVARSGGRCEVAPGVVIEVAT